MKQKIVLILAAVAVLGAIAVYLASWRINMVFNEKGEMQAGLTDFTVRFEGSDKYSDKELATFLFGESLDVNPLKVWWDNTFNEPVEIPFIEEYDIETEGFFDYVITFYDKSIVGYVTYMGINQYFDKDGIVVESSSELLDDIPYITGLEVDYIVLHSKLPVSEEKVFDLLLNITQLIKKYDMDIGRIHVSDDMNIRLYLGNVRIDLGKGDMLNEKFMDLNDIIPNLKDIKGVLDMREYDAGNNGYTFKRDE